MRFQKITKSVNPLTKFGIMVQAYRHWSVNILAPLCVQYNNTTPQRLSSFMIEIVEFSPPGVQEA
jgi:hypothetical protein